MKIAKYPVAILIWLCILQVACKRKDITYYQSANAETYKKIFELKDSSSVTFPLDSTTGYSTSSIQYYKGLLSILNAEQNALSIYDYKKGTLYKKLKFPVVGPNNVGRLDVLAHHYIISLDSILVYNARQGKLYILNQHGMVYKQITLVDYKNSNGIATPDANVKHPLLVLKNILYFPCDINERRTKYSDLKTILKCNLQTGKIEYIATMPEIYDKAFWGEYFKYQISFTYNDKTENLVLHYPIDPFVYTANPADAKKTGKYFIGSEKFKGIEPMNDDITYPLRRDQNAEDKFQTLYSLTTNDYAAIFYDKYRNIYYRIAFLRPSKSQFNAGIKKPASSVIVVNDKFEKLCEVPLSKDYDGNIFFISPDGLNILNYKAYLNNENLLTFSVFNLTKLK